MTLTDDCHVNQSKESVILKGLREEKTKVMVGSCSMTRQLPLIPQFCAKNQMTVFP